LSPAKVYPSFARREKLKRKRSQQTPGCTMYQIEDNGVFDIVEYTSRFTLNSASQSPASRRAEQRQRSIQRRQHTMPQRMIYDESKLLELGSPGKENLLPSEELSFYDSHSPQSHSPRPCSPSMLCPEDTLGGSELLPSENNTPSKHMIMPLGSKTGMTVSAANVGIKMASLSYRLRRPLDDHDPNSMDSGYGASVLNDALLNSLNNSSTVASGGVSTASVSAASKLHSMFHFHSSASSASISRHSSASSPTSSRRLLHSSLSSGSMESMDDMELFDMEAIEEQDSHQLSGSLYQAPVHQQQQQHQPTLLPSGLNTLICGTIKTTHTATTPEQKRPFVRRCLSLNENATNQLPASPLASNVAGAAQMKTPDRCSRRAIAMDDQENCTPFSSRSAMEVTRCFKRPEPPGVSPVQSKRYKTTQFDAPALAAEAIPVPPSVNDLDSPARTTVLAAVPKKPVYQKSISMNDAQIMTALSRSSSEPDLIGDFSKSYALPLMKGQHRDLKSISGETMARLLHGAFDDKVESFKIIDCRYPYEFEGGHIRGAKNLYTQEQIIEELIKSKSEPPQVADQENASLRRHIIVFHCEFSSERGPKLSRFLRNHDRILNENSYPALYYPEMYLLHGGYKEFFKAHADLCDPIAYRPMLDPEYGDAYRHFRAKSRSWNGDGTGTVKASAAAPSSSFTTGNRLTKSRSRLML
uniref:protein-tyrosine-phosphatase n=1 Tax=Anopheles atroparvus TaxID=41427 RepID=A0A182J052_ANOAO